MLHYQHIQWSAIQIIFSSCCYDLTLMEASKTWKKKKAGIGSKSKKVWLEQKYSHEVLRMNEQPCHTVVARAYWPTHRCTKHRNADMNNYFANSTGREKPDAKLFSGNPWPQNLYTCILALFSTHLALKLHLNAHVTDAEWKPGVSKVKYVAITLTV